MKRYHDCLGCRYYLTWQILSLERKNLIRLSVFWNIQWTRSITFSSKVYTTPKLIPKSNALVTHVIIIHVSTYFYSISLSGRIQKVYNVCPCFVAFDFTTSIIEYISEFELIQMMILRTDELKNVAVFSVVCSVHCDDKNVVF